MTDKELIKEAAGTVEKMVSKRLQIDTRDFLYVPNSDEIKELIDLIQSPAREALERVRDGTEGIKESTDRSGIAKIFKNEALAIIDEEIQSLGGE